MAMLFRKMPSQVVEKVDRGRLFENVQMQGAGNHAA
jgi:hypothetical protein